MTLDQLTPREMEILRCILEGQTNNGIAERLGLSPQTIKNRLTTIFEKMGVRNRTQLAISAVRVIGPPEQETPNSPAV